jgi:hypothetical protein
VDENVRTRFEQEIEAGIKRAEGRPFQWGTDDCLMWCAAIVLRACGPDIGSIYRGYSDKEGAALAIGRGGLAAECRRRAKHLGLKPVLPRGAKPGDWGVIQTPTGQASALKFRGPWWVGRGEEGVTYIREDRVSVAWSIA